MSGIDMHPHPLSLKLISSQRLRTTNSPPNLTLDQQAENILGKQPATGVHVDLNRDWERIEPVLKYTFGEDFSLSKDERMAIVYDTLIPAS